MTPDPNLMYAQAVVDTYTVEIKEVLHRFISAHRILNERIAKHDPVNAGYAVGRLSSLEGMVQHFLDRLQETR